jgi:hypothetical protein
MASKNGPGRGNKFARAIKNYEMIGAGKKETNEQILQRGPNTPQKKIEEIKKQKEGPEKDK